MLSVRRADFSLLKMDVARDKLRDPEKKWMKNSLCAYELHDAVTDRAGRIIRWLHGHATEKRRSTDRSLEYLRLPSHSKGSLFE